MTRPLPTNPSGGPYSRPDLGIWRAWFWRDYLDPMRTVESTARWLTLTGIAATAATALGVIRVWRAISEHDDEIGD